ncbi:MAG: hypothetical protein OEV59_03120 [Deltaproteobacteria bacterium]|nr:hypothetical protein [Deltaproteobacteria bacterium]
MNPLTKTPNRKLATIIVVVVLFLLSTFGALDRVAGFIGGDSVAAHNKTYLDNSFDRALTAFIVLSALKTGLAIVKGSEVEVSLVVGAQVNVGGAVQAAYDAVDTAWKTLAVCMAVLVGTHYALDAASAIDAWALSAAFFFLACFLAVVFYAPACRRTRRVLRDLTVVAATVSAMLYIALPLSVTGGSYISDRITTPAVEAAEKSVTMMKNAIFPPWAFEGEGVIEKARATKDTMARALVQIRARSKDLAGNLMRIMAGYAFDAVVFPLILFYALFRGVRAAVVYAVAIGRTEDMKEQLIEAMREGSSHKP